MKRLNALMEDELYIECLEKNRFCERDRIFCGHDLNHFLDTARIAYIKALEEGLAFSKEIIYTAAILHDIGRFRQYEENIPHNIASHHIGKYLLEKYSYNEEEKTLILDAILNHRSLTDNENSLNRLLYESDKLSRMCFNCKATKECNWSDEKKNLKIRY